MDILVFFVIITVTWLILALIANPRWLQLKNPEIGFGTIIWRTKKVNDLIEEIGDHGKGFWEVFFDIGIIVCFGLLAASVLIFTINLLKFIYLLLGELGFVEIPEQVDPIDAPMAVAPAIPGLTISLDTLPYFLIAILIGAIVHELSHGIAAALGKIELKSTGIVVFFVLMGAFVEPVEEKLNAASPRAKLRVFAAGAMANITLFFFLLIFLFPPVYEGTTSLLYASESSGIIVKDNSPDGAAELSGMEPGWVITGVTLNKTYYSMNNVMDLQDFRRNTPLRPKDNLSVHFLHQNDVILTAGQDPNNSTLGLIGIYTVDYRAPHLDFLPLLLPYYYLLLLFYTAMISLMLALFNLLPIPPLDGDKLLGVFFQNGDPRLQKVFLYIRIFTIVVIVGNMLLTFLLQGWVAI